MIAILVALTIFIVSAVTCHRIAVHRRSNAVFWGAMGFTFGPLAIPFAFFSKPSVKLSVNNLKSTH